MTSPNSPEQKLIEALEWYANGEKVKYKITDERGKFVCDFSFIQKRAQESIPLACSLIAELAELRDKAEALEWITSRLYTDRAGTVWMRPIADANSCPAIIKQMIEQKEHTK